MDDLTIPQIIAVALLPVLLAITLHEVAHGWVARLLGDDTAARMGRLSLNPIHHVDPLGTLLVPLLMFQFTGFMFGWAKPVPVNFGRLRKPRRDMALVAIAGPAANLCMALFWALLIRLALTLDFEYVSVPLQLMGNYGIAINLILMLVNLLPIPPLDGSRLVTGLLPYRMAERFAKIEPYGFLILLALMFTNVLSVILGIPMHVLQELMYGVAGLR